MFRFPSHKTMSSTQELFQWEHYEQKTKYECGLTDFMCERVPLALAMMQVTMLPINLKARLEKNETHFGKRGSARVRNKSTFLNMNKAHNRVVSRIHQNRCSPHTPSLTQW